MSEPRVEKSDDERSLGGTDFAAGHLQRLDDGRASDEEEQAVQKAADQCQADQVVLGVDAVMDEQQRRAALHQPPENDLQRQQFPRPVGSQGVHDVDGAGQRHHEQQDDGEERRGHQDLAHVRKGVHDVVPDLVNVQTRHSGVQVVVAGAPERVFLRLHLVEQLSVSVVPAAVKLQDGRDALHAPTFGFQLCVLFHVGMRKHLVSVCLTLEIWCFEKDETNEYV